MVLPSLPVLFTEYAPYVGRLLRYLGVRDADLEDACQEVFLVAFRKLASLRPDASPRAWLYGICINEARQRRRVQARVKSEPLDSEPNIPSGASSSEARYGARQVALGFLDALDDEKREIFLLHDVEELPMREICDALAIPLQTGYSRLRHGRERLQIAVAKSKERGAV